jgi:peptide/nickel transport system permease protein
MFRLIAKRLAWAVPMLFAVSFFSFALVSLSPTDPARIIAGPFATQADVVQVRTELGLDDPLLTRYGRWVGDAVKGDFGTSISFTKGVKVSKLLNDRLTSTLSTVGLSLITAAVVGVGLGVFSAVRGGSSGRAASLLSLFGLAIPGFWLALVMVTFFAVTLKWFPAIGYVPLSVSPMRWAKSLVLPVAAIALAPIASLTKITRDAMTDALGRDFVRVLQANGLPRRSVIYRHALKNAAIPIATLLGIQAVTLIGAAAIIEDIFAIPGLGSLAVKAAGVSDLPLIQGAVVYFCLIVVVVGVLVDISYSFLDPRVRVK